MQLLQLLRYKRLFHLLESRFKATSLHYFLGEAVWVNVTIHNQSKAFYPFRFDYYKQDLFHHFDLQVTPLNRQKAAVPKSLTYSEWQHHNSANIGAAKSQSAETKRIELDYMESFTTMIDISKWVQFTEEGKYFVEGTFYPNPSFKEDELTYIIPPVSIKYAKKRCVL